MSQVTGKERCFFYLNDEVANVKQDILIISLRISQSEEVHSLFAQNAVTSELVNHIPTALRQLAAHTPAFLWIDLEMETARLVLDEIANAFIHPPPYIVEICRTNPEKIQNFVTIYYKIRCTMTKTDAGSVDTNTVGGSCMYGENICRCCLKEKKYCKRPLQSDKYLAASAMPRSSAGRAPPSFR